MGGGADRHAKGGAQVIGELAGLLVLHARLKLLALVVEVAHDGHFGLGLPFEEGIVQLLVVDVDATHLGSDAFAHFGFERFRLLLFLQSRAHLHNARLLDEVGQVERRLLNTTLALFQSKQLVFVLMSIPTRHHEPDLRHFIAKYNIIKTKNTFTPNEKQLHFHDSFLVVPVV